MAYETLIRVVGPGIRAEAIVQGSVVAWIDAPLHFLTERPLSELQGVCATLGLRAELIGWHHYKFTGGSRKKNARRRR